jgi:uncharacterized tellurite resistance protein B-like protein
MLDLAKKFFGKGTTGDPKGNEGGTSHDIRVATCALLLELSQIDGEFSAAERGHVLSVLKSEYGLSDEYAESLLEASRQELEGSIDLWQFTNLINQNYTREEKCKIIETIWKIAYTDGRLDKHEDYLMHKLGSLLRLSHKELIDAKLKAKGPATKN